MDGLEHYKPWESHLGGNDLACLEQAHKRARFALRGIMLVGYKEQQVKMKEPLPAREQERLTELLTSGSLLKYEEKREAWSEVVRCLPPTL